MLRGSHFGDPSVTQTNKWTKHSLIKLCIAGQWVSTFFFLPVDVWCCFRWHLYLLVSLLFMFCSYYWDSHFSKSMWRTGWVRWKRWAINLSWLLLNASRLHCALGRGRFQSWLLGKDVGPTVEHGFSMFLPSLHIVEGFGCSEKGSVDVPWWQSSRAGSTVSARPKATWRWTILQRAL
jgi:hypothetical protein